MPNNERAAVVHLRMSPQLRDALRRAALNAGCSMNAYAVQVLATAAGDPACFRANVDAPHESPRPAQTWRHKAARESFMFTMAEQIGFTAANALVKKYDAEDPGFYIPWWERRAAERNG
jgi:hypothetical protein